MNELYDIITTYISVEEQAWLAGMWCMVMVFPYLFIKTSERAMVYCEQRHARLTTRGIRVIALLYLLIYVVYISIYFAKFQF